MLDQQLIFVLFGQDAGTSSNELKPWNEIVHLNDFSTRLVDFIESI